MNKTLINEKEIGQRIRALRTSRHMTQEVFACSIFISKSYLALIENGKRGASIDVFAQISKSYGVSIDYLLWGSDETNSDVSYKKWKEITRSRTPLEVDASLAFLENFFEISDRYGMSDGKLHPPLESHMKKGLE